MENEHTCACCRKKMRSEKEQKDLINRLSRIEGQIRGIKGMVEKDCYCPDIITQVIFVPASQKESVTEKTKKWTSWSQCCRN